MGLGGKLVFKEPIHSTVLGIQYQRYLIALLSPVLDEKLVFYILISFSLLFIPNRENGKMYAHFLCHNASWMAEILPSVKLKWSYCNSSFVLEGFLFWMFNGL